eukprot:NODE_585_length_2287_cov_50.667283_g555_i0.p1 GENE.NODE_585_length_2287_cov_50.667283_g555_i0~~NODE_585_length_2287_cov_50.667283_g555_i0.p1  ORF type:complete len:643 (+),score=90.15 NODE_585_length_2287_cov_50.667283_g555_i0:106-2034(+)
MNKPAVSLSSQEFQACARAFDRAAATGDAGPGKITFWQLRSVMHDLGQDVDLDYLKKLLAAIHFKSERKRQNTDPDLIEFDVFIFVMELEKQRSFAPQPKDIDTLESWIAAGGSADKTGQCDAAALKEVIELFDLQLDVLPLLQRCMKTGTGVSYPIFEQIFADRGLSLDDGSEESDEDSDSPNIMSPKMTRMFALPLHSARMRRKSGGLETGRRKSTSRLTARSIEDDPNPEATQFLQRFRSIVHTVRQNLPQSSASPPGSPKASLLADIVLNKIVRPNQVKKLEEIDRSHDNIDSPATVSVDHFSEDETTRHPKKKHHQVAQPMPTNRTVLVSSGSKKITPPDDPKSVHVSKTEARARKLIEKHRAKYERDKFSFVKAPKQVSEVMSLVMTRMSTRSMRSAEDEEPVAPRNRLQRPTTDDIINWQPQGNETPNSRTISTDRHDSLASLHSNTRHPGSCDGDKSARMVRFSFLADKGSGLPHRRHNEEQTEPESPSPSQSEDLLAAEQSREEVNRRKAALRRSSKQIRRKKDRQRSQQRIFGDSVGAAPSLITNFYTLKHFKEQLRSRPASTPIEHFPVLSPQKVMPPRPMSQQETLPSVQSLPPAHSASQPLMDSEYNKSSRGGFFTPGSMMLSSSSGFL